MEPGTVVWHKAGGFPFWPYVVVTPDSVAEKLQQKMKTLAMGVALRCLPLEPALYDVAASNKLEGWTAENCEKHTAVCRKDKRKAVGGLIDTALSEAEQIIAGTLKINAPEPVAPPAPAPAAGKKTVLKLKGTQSKASAGSAPDESTDSAAAPAPASGGPKLKFKVGTKGGAAKGSKAGAEDDQADSSAAAAPDAAGNDTNASAAETGDAASSATDAGTVTGTGGTEWSAPVRPMSKVRAQLLLRMKPAGGALPAIVPGRPVAPAASAQPSSGSASAAQGAPPAAADDGEFTLVKAKKKDKDAKHKDKHKDKDGKHGKDKKKEKEERRSSGAGAAASGGKRKTVVDDSDEDDEEDERPSKASAFAAPAADGAAPATAQQSGIEAGEDAPVLVKKRKRVEKEVEEEEEEEDDDDYDDGGGMGLAALYSSSMGGKRKKAKKQQKKRVGFDAGSDELGEQEADGAGAAEEESPYPSGIPAPPHPPPIEADYERAYTLYSTLKGCTTSGDGQGLISAMTGLLSSTGLPVSTDLLLKSKLVEVIKPLRKLEPGTIPAETPLASDKDLQSEVRETADMVYRRFQTECRELAAWEETHKDALSDWQARQARRKAEQARIAKMQEGKKRRAEERMRALEAEEKAREQAQARAQAKAQEQGAAAASSAAVTSSAVDMELDTAQEQDEPSKMDDESGAGGAATGLGSDQSDGPATTQQSGSAQQPPQPVAKVAPAPTKPVQIATAASLLGLVSVKPAAETKAAGTPSTAPIAASTTSAAASQALDKDLALQLPTNSTRLAGVHLLTALLTQIAVNSRDSERDVVSAVGGSRMPGAVSADSALYFVLQKIATVLDSKLATALQNPSAANVLPQGPLAALRAVMLALERTCDAFPRPDTRALALPTSTAAGSAAGKPAAETISATRKFLALLSEAGPRLRAVPSSVSQLSVAGGSVAEDRQGTSQGPHTGGGETLSQQEREVLAQALPLVPSVLREAFKGQ